MVALYEICTLFFFLSLAAGMGVGVRSMPTGSFGRGGLMLQDPKPSMDPKETSLMIHPDVSIRGVVHSGGFFKEKMTNEEKNA